MDMPTDFGNVSLRLKEAEAKIEDEKTLRAGLAEERDALNDQIIAYQQHAAKSEWIDVNDRLPDDSAHMKSFVVRVYRKNRIDLWYVTSDERKTWNSYKDEVTHWMPMPELKETNTNE